MKNSQTKNEIKIVDELLDIRSAFFPWDIVILISI